MVPRHWLAALAASLPLLASACSDRSSTPTGPREALSSTAIPAASPTCSFSTAKSLATSEFLNGTVKQNARDSVDAMQAGGQFSARARAAGFSIMARIAAAKKLNTAKDAATGSNLTNALIPCMFDPSSGPDSFPATFPVDFTPALDRSQPGAYEVRGPTGDATPVLTFPGPTNNLARISSIEPTTASWSGVLGETTLVYGLPIAGANGPDPDQYEWKTIRPGVTFQTSQGGPGVIVGLCNTTTLNNNDLMNETEVGFLEFVQTPPACTAAFAQLKTTWGPRQLVDALQRFGSGLFRPEPAYASSMMFATTIGGTAKGGKSIYTKKTLDPTVAAVQFTFVVQPSNTAVGKAMSPPVQILASYQGDPVSNVVLTVGGVTNNGTPTEVRCGSPSVSPCQVTTALGGIATIPNLTVTKSGALQLVVSAANIQLRSGIAFATGKRSIKVNIRPK
jgi:hypothetical protein